MNFLDRYRKKKSLSEKKMKIKAQVSVSSNITSKILSHGFGKTRLKELAKGR